MPPPRLLVWVALIASLVVNVVLLFMPSRGGEPLFPYDDKVIHCVLFGVPAYLGLRAGLKPAVWLPAMAGWAVLSEILQARLTATRSGSVWDWCADLVGIGIAVLLGARFRAR